MGLDVPFDINGELTLYGVFAIIGLFLNTKQLKSFLNLICNEKNFSLPNDYKTYDKKLQIMNKYSNLNRIRQNEKDLEIVFCEEQFLITVVSEFFIFLEEDILKKENIRVIPNRKYISSPK